MFNMNDIGRLISKLRKEHNLTQVELADQLGISYQAVSNWERGDSMPDISKLSELATIFNVSIDELLGHTKQADTIKEIIADKVVDVKDLDEETLQDVLPLVKPKQVEKNIDFSNVTFEQLKSVAPFIDEKILDEAVLESLDDVSVNDIVSLAPFMSSTAISQVVLKAYASDDFKVSDIIAIIPFVDQEIVDALASKLSERELIPLAPFLSDEVVSDIVKKTMEEGRLKDVIGLMPFAKGDFFDKETIKNMFKKK